jgi:hypothetical protein
VVGNTRIKCNRNWNLRGRMFSTFPGIGTEIAHFCQNGISMLHCVAFDFLSVRIPRGCVLEV